MSSFVDSLVTGLVSGNTYALIALGLSLIFGVADLINFAQGSVFAFGAMLGWYCVAQLHLPFGVAFVIVVAATALLGLLIERVAVRPLAQAPRIAALLSTVAFGLILDRVSQLIFGPERQMFPNPLPDRSFWIGNTRVDFLDITIFVVTLGSVTLLWFFLSRTRIGRALRATAQDRDAARQMGVNVNGLQGVAFAVSSALAGIGGILVGMYDRNVDPTMGFNAGMEGFAAAALGGLGNLPGALVGGLLLGVIESFGVSWFGGSTRPLFTFGVLILVFWLRPSGLLGALGTALREPMTGMFFGQGRPVALRRWHIVLLVVLAAGVIPAFANAYILRVATMVSIYAILGLSLTLVAGTAGIISLGQAGFFAIGAYASALLVKNADWPFWFALPAAGAVAAILGAVLVSPTLKLRGHYSAIVTLGLGAIVTAAILNLTPLTGGPQGINNIPPAMFFLHPLLSPRESYWLALGVLFVCTAIVVALQRSHLGRVWNSLRDDEIAAQSSGVRASSYKSLAFTVGAFVAAVGGSLLAAQYTYISPDSFGIDVSILALMIALLGGMTNVPGTILGAIVLIGAPELFRPLHDVRVLAYGLLLLLFVRFRPQGLWRYR